MKNRDMKIDGGLHNASDDDGLSLYLHIPFCVKKCDYCDFLSAPADETTRESYVNALIREIALYQDSEPAGRPVSSIFIGGGTPSVLTVKQLCGIMDGVRRVFSVEKTEITMEVNPGTVTAPICAELCKHIANRFSLGLQSANDKELAYIGRIHTYSDFLETYDAFRNSDCHNINVDLMSALPGQSISSYVDSLHKVISLKPEHISAYSLILEEGTPLYEKYHSFQEMGDYVNQKTSQNILPLPEEEEERRMYEMTEEILAENGYQRYEISNYAKDGYACRHNLTYWKRRDYLGLGLGASSCVDNVRWKNTDSLHNYIKLLGSTAEGLLSFSEKDNGLRKEIVKLSVKEQMEETMFLGLRMTEGVSKTEFFNRFGRKLTDVYRQVIDRYKSMGMLEENTERVFLTNRGIDVSNHIFADFLLD